jgi:hypothetical protein
MKTITKKELAVKISDSIKQTLSAEGIKKSSSLEKQSRNAGRRIARKFIHELKKNNKNKKKIVKKSIAGKHK